VGAGLSPGLAALALALLATLPVACGTASEPVTSSAIPRTLLLGARPIGRGRRFHLPATGPLIGPCTRRLGPRDVVHVELFAANRVVLVPAGIGARPPVRFSSGRISGASCYGALVTIDPTGLVLVSRSRRLALADLFRSWGQLLSPRRLAAFPAPRGTAVSVFIDGRRWHGTPGSVALTARAEIVLEVGPYVPPHTAYTFPPVP
jgi:hypothetical protein